MAQTKRHKVFISFHHDDQVYKDWFVQVMEDDIVDKSVEDGDIDDTLSTERMRQIIRDDHIADATVIVVLIGPCTWQRKHVDWEIGSSLRKNEKKILAVACWVFWLPNHPDFGKKKYKPHLIPPRLADNFKGDDHYACIYDWPRKRTKAKLRKWIHRAFKRRKKKPNP